MNGTYGNTSVGQQTGPKLIDDFLRRELRVGDPRNAKEVVTALRRRYATDATRLDQEAAGLPIRYDAQALMMPAAPVADTPGSKEERRVQADLESDLAALVESRDNREWAPEIRGWRDTLLREYSDGAAAARFAQDPAMRDRGFLAVRKLAEFARVARLVGVMNLPLSCDYRRLASTLDDAANVIRILMGEALYAAGLADGGVIIQVPTTELRDRRDALTRAVETLSGAAGALDPDDWGDAIAAYRALLQAIDNSSAPELRVYLRSETLVPIVDAILSSVSRQDPEALRQIAATVPVEIARLRRLLAITIDLLNAAPPPAPPIAAALTAFSQALQLFIDAFQATRSGARLIDLAVPLPMAVKQVDEADREGRRVLRDLVSARGEYALEVECFLSCCGCQSEQLASQVKLDKVLYDLDRAIDLYAQGEGRPPDWGDEERRAGVYGIIAQNLAADRSSVTPGSAFAMLVSAALAGIDLLTARARLTEAQIVNANLAGNAPLVAFLTPTVTEATDVARVLRACVVAAEAASTSRALEEGILRELVMPAAGPVVFTAGQWTRLTTLVNVCRTLPFGVQGAIGVALEVTELCAGASGVGAIAGIPSVAPPGDPGGVVPALALLGALSAPMFVAVVTLGSAAVALNDGVRAIGDFPFRAAPFAGNTATAAAANAAAAAAAAYPAPPAVPPPVHEQTALTAAHEAALAATQLARGALALPATSEIAPAALWQILTEVGILLAAALPAPGSLLRQQLLTTVFEEQLRSEQDWEILVRSLAPRCLGPGRAELVTAARELLFGNPNFRVRNPAPLILPNPPPDERVSLDQIAQVVLRWPPPPGGGGRVPWPGVRRGWRGGPSGPGPGGTPGGPAPKAPGAPGAGAVPPSGPTPVAGGAPAGKPSPPPLPFTGGATVARPVPTPPTSGGVTAGRIATSPQGTGPGGLLHGFAASPVAPAPPPPAVPPARPSVPSSGWYGAPLTSDDLEAIGDLLLLTSAAINASREHGSNVRALRSEWNGWMESIREGKSFLEEPFRVVFEDKKADLTDVLGWDERDPDRALTLNEIVLRAAGPYVHSRFDKLFTDIAEDDKGKPSEIFEEKQALLRECWAIKMYYWSLAGGDRS